VRLLRHAAARSRAAGARLREGLDETPTVISLDGALHRTFCTTSQIENLNGLIGQFTANVKRWRDWQMALR